MKQFETTLVKGVKVYYTVWKLEKICKKYPKYKIAKQCHVLSALQLLYIVFDYFGPNCVLLFCWIVIFSGFDFFWIYILFYNFWASSLLLMMSLMSQNRFLSPLRSTFRLFQFSTGFGQNCVLFFLGLSVTSHGDDAIESFWVNRERICEIFSFRLFWPSCVLLFELLRLFSCLWCNRIGFWIDNRVNLPSFF